MGLATGLGAYRQVLSDPRARAFAVAGFVARLPLSMTGMGISAGRAVVTMASSTGTIWMLDNVDK